MVGPGIVLWAQILAPLWHIQRGFFFIFQWRNFIFYCLRLKLKKCRIEYIILLCGIGFNLVFYMMEKYAFGYENSRRKIKQNALTIHVSLCGLVLNWDMHAASVVLHMLLCFSKVGLLQIERTVEVWKKVRIRVKQTALS